MKQLMIVVGEASGDMLAAEVVQALRQHYPQLQLSGVGGDALQELGLTSLVPLSDVNVMGLLNIIPSLQRIRRAVHTVVEAAIAHPPDALLVVDSLDFTHAIAKRLRKKMPHLCIVRYAAPKLWAWRPYRAHKLRGFYDALAVLFPFETEFFAKYNIDATFVGHPVVQRVLPATTLPPNAPLLLLPGSRRSEITRLLPLFLQTAQQLQQQDATLKVCIATLPHWQPLIDRIQQQHGSQYLCLTQDRFAVMSQARAALAASGTVVLELAAAHVPTVAAYKVDALSAWLAKKLICVPYVTLPNLLLNQAVVPELLQDNCTPHHLAWAISPLLYNAQARTTQQHAFTQCMHLLGRDAVLTPAQQAATCIIKAWQKRTPALLNFL